MAWACALAGLGVVGIAEAAFLFGTPLLGSDGSTARADGRATVTKDFGCLLLAADSGLAIDLFTVDKTHEVDAVSGNTTLTCHFDIPAGFGPPKAIKNSGFPCGTYAGLATNSMSVVSPGGKALLRCQIKPSP